MPDGISISASTSVIKQGPGGKVDAAWSCSVFEACRWYAIMQTEDGEAEKLICLVILDTTPTAKTDVAAIRVQYAKQKTLVFHLGRVGCH